MCISQQKLTLTHALPSFQYGTHRSLQCSDNQLRRLLPEMVTRNLRCYTSLSGPQQQHVVGAVVDAIRLSDPDQAASTSSSSKRGQPQASVSNGWQLSLARYEEEEDDNDDLASGASASSRSAKSRKLPSNMQRIAQGEVLAASRNSHVPVEVLWSEVEGARIAVRVLASTRVAKEGESAAAKPAPSDAVQLVLSASDVVELVG